VKRFSFCTLELQPLMSRAELQRILFILPLLLAVLSARGQTLSSAPLPDLASADALGEDLFLQSGSTGMVLVVVRGNQVFFHGYGETAPGSHQVPTRDSLLRLCSLTKIFTADLLVKLAEDKTVRLGDLRES
jgi:serine-type D-Ala-D-Ala carboxypeptidase/endopeptidase